MKKYIILISLSLSTLFANDKPQDAIQLIGADGVKNLVNEIEPDKELTWLFKDGILTVGEGHIVTSMPVNDFKAHIEFKVINAPTKNKKKK